MSLLRLRGNLVVSILTYKGKQCQEQKENAFIVIGVKGGFGKMEDQKERGKKKMHRAYKISLHSEDIGDHRNSI